MSSPTQSESLDQTPGNPNMDQREDPPDPDSQPSKTLTLDSSPDSHRAPLELVRSDDAAEDLSANDTDLPSPVASAATAVGASAYRRGAKRKKGGPQKRRAAQEKKSMKKLKVLNETLKPIPFVPVKNLDFSSQEKLLRRLGLWDFVHIGFDRTIRADLLAQLIANFNHPQRCSYVNGVRVKVNRADLARALKLPVKKPAVSSDSAGAEEELVVTEESIGFMEDFVSNWLLLHDELWMMPNEVLNWMKAIKEGSLEKVDWAGMIWFMIEKELMQAPQLTDCYYASHLQCLIKSQREELLLLKEVVVVEEEPKVEVDVKEDEVLEEEEEVDASGDMRMDGVDVSVDAKIETIEATGDAKIGVIDASGDVRVDAVDANGEAESGLIDANGDVRMDRDDSGFRSGGDLEERNTELSLGGQDNAVAEHGVELSLGGQDNVVEKAEEEVEKEEKEQAGDETLMELEGCKEEDDEPAQWLLGKNNVGGESIFLRQCSFGVDIKKDSVCSFGVEAKRELGFEDERNQEEEDEEEGVGQEEGGREEVEEDEEEEMEEDQEEEQEGQEGGFNLSPKGLSLDGFPPGGLIHSMEAAQMTLGPGMPLRNPLGGEFLSSRDDARMPSVFGNGGTSKREIGLENDDSHYSLNAHKRLRIDGTWDNGKLSCDFDMCMDQIQQLIGKARVMYAAKEQACSESTMSHQVLMHELEQRDNMIDQLHKMRMEDQQKRQMEVYRLERELNLMSNLLEGYRKALKETQRAFTEYRARHPQLDEPLYKDVAGSSGLVLSIMELEKQRLKQEEEDRISRLAIEREIKDFEAWWDGKFTEFGKNVNVLENKLLSVEHEMKLLKESYAKQKVSETPEPAPVES